MKTITEYLKSTHPNRPYSVRPYTKIGGIIMSIQASDVHYCAPRANRADWTLVEIGYPNRKIPELMPYAEDKNNPTATVYGYVPVSVIDNIIKNNGGDIKPLPQNYVPPIGEAVL